MKEQRKIIIALTINIILFLIIIAMFVQILHLLPHGSNVLVNVSNTCPKL